VPNRALHLTVPPASVALTGWLWWWHPPGAAGFFCRAACGDGGPAGERQVVGRTRLVTHAYQWFSLPRIVTVRCPSCRGPALLRRDPEVQSPVRGKLACDDCHHVCRNIVVTWPDDAFFVCTVRGQVLWAWSSQHVQAIRDFVESKTRKPGAHRGFKAALMHLPEHFLLAKNRAPTLKALDRLLAPSRRAPTRARLAQPLPPPRAPPNKPF
jgi:hypothetical protein